MWPPLCRTMPYTVASPSPVPLPRGLVVKNGSDQGAPRAPAHPHPVSGNAGGRVRDDLGLLARRPGGRTVETPHPRGAGHPRQHFVEVVRDPPRAPPTGILLLPPKQLLPRAPARAPPAGARARRGAGGPEP